MFVAGLAVLDQCRDVFNSSVAVLINRVSFESRSHISAVEFSSRLAEIGSQLMCLP